LKVVSSNLFLTNCYLKERFCLSTHQRLELTAQPFCVE
jgi:hypothetical protein